MVVALMVVEEVWRCGCMGRVKETDKQLARAGKDRQTARKEGRAYLKRPYL